MNTLRTKIIILIVVANLTIVGMAASVVPLVFSRPPYDSFANFSAAYISFILDNEINRGDQQSAVQGQIRYFKGVEIRDQPADGKNLEERAERLRTALENWNKSFSLIVTKPHENFWLENLWPVASVSLPDNKWLVVPVVMPPPREEALPLLLGLLCLIIAGTTIVAVMAVRRQMRPLALIENCVSSINFQGELPRVPETGPPMPKAAGGVSAATANGKLFVFGGEQWEPNQDVVSNVWAYDPATDEWSEMPNMMPPRHGTAAASIRNRIFVFGGAVSVGANAAATNESIEIH